MKKWVLLFSLLALVSCQNKADQESEDVQLQRATRNIDKGEYNDAIQSLQTLKTKSTNPKVVMTLASAYAGRAGIKVDQYWGFVVGYESLLPEFADSDKVKSQKYAISSQWIAKIPSEQDRKSAEELNKILVQMDGILARIERIPYVAREHREDLHTAVSELSELKTQGSALYKAILEVILLKSAIEDTRTIFESLRQKGSNCERSGQELLTWVKYSWQLLTQIFEDVAVAYPSKKESIEKVASPIRPAASLLSSNALLIPLAKVCQ